MNQDDEHKNTDAPDDESSEVTDMTEKSELSQEDIAYVLSSSEEAYARKSVRNWTIGGAVLGLVFGFSFLPAGIFLGPIIGAIVHRLGRRIWIGISRATDRTLSKLPAPVQIALAVIAVILAIVMIAT